MVSQPCYHTIHNLVHFLAFKILHHSREILNLCLLINSVGYDVNDMNTLFHEVCGDVVDDYTVHSTLMSSGDGTSAIKKLKTW